ncbi:hypothetical protein AN963_15385 [Brevibacillus choshinensis]|uniref:Phosphatidic acid phosphatase type 2/haloperoxidase domain-containing protein n=1 Tax=Brevibacillus choshinensis TaxID=54911 RepID=A0ABR5N6S8_BRECH|nr:phosphatase PAP2 family protein [Brevibacillus choshinensis]KQL46343.1 hypothetical protein AN963_15385 [Brevibacillus choshinensis]
MNQTKLPSLSRKTRQYVWFCVLFIVAFVYAFAKLGSEMLEQELSLFDSAVIGWVQSGISPALTSFMLFITFLGSTSALLMVITVAAGLMWWQKKRWEALFLVIALGGGVLFNLVLKWSYHRERPSILRLVEEEGFSFPSGHSMASFILYGMIGILLYLFVVSRAAKVAIVVIVVALILLIGTSRIYLGVHYPSDVLAGYTAGGAWLAICLLGLRLVVEKRKGKMEK